MKTVMYFSINRVKPIVALYALREAGFNVQQTYMPGWELKVTRVTSKRKRDKILAVMKSVDPTFGYVGGPR